MHLLPVAARELRVAARRRRTYWGRFAMALGAMVVGAWFWLSFSLGGGMAPGTMGFALFTTLASVALLHCLGAGFYAVDAISREKRDGTLGLLFLTDLRGHDVLAGKLVATGIHALLALAAIVPVLSVCLLLGGISLQVLTRTVLALLNVLGLSLACGLLVSTLSRESRVAASGLVLMLLVLCFGGPLLAYLEADLLRKVGPDQVRSWLYLPSPIVAFASAFSSPAVWSGVPRDPYWWSMGTLHALTWLFLLLTARWVTGVWQEKTKRGIWWWLERAKHWLNYGNSTDRQQRRTRLLEVNPVCWLCSRERWRTPAVWGVLAVATAGWIFGYAKMGRDWLSPPVAITVVLCLHGIFKYWLAAEACRRFAEDRTQGSFELLLSTSMTVRQILRGRWLALGRTFGGAWAVLATIDLVLFTLSTSGGDGAANRRELTLCLLAAVGFLGVHFFALGWVGMWRGLTAKSLNQAVSLTVSHVLIWPWVIFWLLSIGLALMQQTFLRLAGMAVFSPFMGWGFQQWFMVWAAVMLGLNLGGALHARHRLLRRFRELATDRSFRRQRGGWRRRRTKQAESG